MVRKTIVLLSLQLALLACTKVAFTAEYAQSRQRISILGDSYSTFVGFIPEGNAIWYDGTTNKTDVTEVQQTWWWKVVREGGYLLEKNESFSGSTVCYTGYNGADYAAISFLSRLHLLGSPDILLIFGCTNDSWAGAQIGEFRYGSWTKADLYFYRPALAKLLADAQAHYPNVEIWFLINDGLREDITESTKEICAHYGVPYIELKNIDKLNGHPSVAGMEAIARQVLDAIFSGEDRPRTN